MIMPELFTLFRRVGVMRPSGTWSGIASRRDHAAFSFCRVVRRVVHLFSPRVMTGCCVIRSHDTAYQWTGDGSDLTRHLFARPSEGNSPVAAAGPPVYRLQ